MTSRTTPPAWFHNAVIDGLELLYALRPPGCPAADVLPLTTTGWIEVLWRGGLAWSEVRDQGRISSAFLSLGGAVDRWPTPAQLLQHLPAVATAQALPAPTPVMTDARRAELAAMRRRLADMAVGTNLGAKVAPNVGTSCGSMRPAAEAAADVARRRQGS